MASILNADTSNGLKITSDTSGEIKLQSAGADIVSVTANGIDITGGFTVDTNTLYVDATNNNVGINTSTLQHYGTGITNFTVAGSTIPIIHLNSTGGASNAKLWRWIARNDSTMQFQTLEDNYGGERNIWNVARSGADISYQAWHTGASVERMRIDSGGKLLHGFTSSQSNGRIQFYNPNGAGGYGLQMFGETTGGSYQIEFLTANSGSYTACGTITTSGSSTTYGTTSDYRLKENNVNIIDGIERVKLLKPYRFNFIANPDITVDGFYAHEVQDIVPEAITETKDAVDDEGNPKYQNIDQSKLVPLLTAALQEAITKIEDLETRIQALENA